MNPLKGTHSLPEIKKRECFACLVHTAADARILSHVSKKSLLLILSMFQNNDDFTFSPFSQSCIAGCEMLCAGSKHKLHSLVARSY